ncbi:hypothetical protein ACIQU6_08650 [Streptomyces sp. NPDC090442]|uniref:hypothetical protein n=1 Tax=Streptomyces sp. NPDC090442 TaxID=3365962 RepID=UPI00381675F3
MESERLGDIPIFASRAHIARPRLAAGDGPVAAYRRWARQFHPSHIFPASRPHASPQARKDLDSLL